jgi:hypothetical protein
MPDFVAGSYSDIAVTPTGRALWKFLNEKATVECLEKTTYLKHPALEGLQPELLAKFGDEIRSDRWKQMIGRMTRQVMEHHGYTLDQTGVRIRVTGLFTSAARYKKIKTSQQGYNPVGVGR